MYFKYKIDLAALERHMNIVCIFLCVVLIIDL